MTTITERPSPVAVCIVACGYRSVQSPRTASLTFPAHLIQFPSGKRYWRSKRDFLLLFRASTSPPPKAALKKLTGRAPWKRPGTLGENDEDDDNYEPFMKKSVRMLDQYLQRLSHHSTQHDDALGQAWQIFERPFDTEGLVRITESSVTLTEPSRTSVGSKLGQYFCCESTARQLVQLTLDYIQEQKLENVIFLEPSCGHGDVVWELLKQLEQRPGVLLQYKIVAYDIDDLAVLKCREQHDDQSLVQWNHGDFLTTTDTVLSNDDAPPVVIALGGPPYTSGAGSGEEIDRDLPNYFLKHCQTWKAQFVAFILPERYRNQNLAASDERWSVSTSSIASSVFYFQGHRKVTQPSIIQCFRRNDLGVQSSSI